MSMVSVRFPPSTVKAIRHYAQRDGVTVSKWLRILVERELKVRDRTSSAVDFRMYPQTRTAASGQVISAKIFAGGPQTYTGYGPW